jgi:hypothetical protein
MQKYEFKGFYISAHHGNLLEVVNRPETYVPDFPSQ